MAEDLWNLSTIGRSALKRWNGYSPRHTLCIIKEEIKEFSENHAE